MSATNRVLASLAVLGLLAAGCGDDDGSEPAAPTTTTSAPATTMAGPATVQVADHAELGKLLVGPDGRTLYLFERDQGTTSACTGGCASVWPALTASGQPTAGEGVDDSKLSTANGQVPNHVAYNAHLLYFFARDMKPGDVNGRSVPSWFPVDPDGNKIDRE